MTFDELKENWQQQNAGKLSIEPDLLLKEVQRNKRHFESTIFWRDVQEVGIAFIMFLFFTYVALENSEWLLLLIALSVLFVAVFLLTDRIIQRRKRKKAFQSLVICIDESLSQVVHQIWLLKNVLWWYLLPMYLGVAIFTCYSAWDARDHIGWFMFDIVYLAIFTLFVWGVYALNQWAVRKQLIPRRKELMQLQNSLQNSTE